MTHDANVLPRGTFTADRSRPGCNSCLTTTHDLNEYDLKDMTRMLNLMTTRLVKRRPSEEESGGYQGNIISILLSERRYRDLEHRDGHSKVTEIDGVELSERLYRDFEKVYGNTNTHELDRVEKPERPRRDLLKGDANPTVTRVDGGIAPRECSTMDSSTSSLNLPGGRSTETQSQNLDEGEAPITHSIAREELESTYFPLTLGDAGRFQTDLGPSQSSLKRSLCLCLGRTPSKAETKKSKRSSRKVRVRELADDPFRNVRKPPVASTYQSKASGIDPILVTPYGSELTKLRKDRLRIEEDRLQELNRRLVLEQTRGPKAKWYEFKCPKFNYEAHKNHQMILLADIWDDISTYRNELMKASEDLQRFYELRNRINK